MPFTRYMYKHKDNVAATLNAGISAATLSIPLTAGQGSQFPTTYNGTCTSLGSSATLNCTGIGATGVAVGDIIENVTDGSYAVVKSVSTNSLTTTRLKGGSDNTWQNLDKWHVNRFVVTLIQYDTDNVTILKREKVLIDSRSGDTLTVNASGRGFDGSVAQTFLAGNYVYLFSTSAANDGIRQAISQLTQDIDNLISQGNGEIYAADGGGTDAYAITLVPAPTAYITGMVVNFKANTANVGTASLNVNGLGVKTIRKNNDQTLEDNDIEAGQVVTVVYDGTYFQMQSQVANLFASQTNVQKGAFNYAADGGASDAYAITLSPAPTAYVAGMVIQFKANTANTGTATLNVNSLGAKTIKKNYNATLDTGDILAGQLVSVIYDATNDCFQMLSPSASVGAVYKSGIFSKNLADASTSQTIAHGLGKTPRFIRLTMRYGAGATHRFSEGVFDGTTTSCVYISNNGTSNVSAGGTSSTYVVFNAQSEGGDYQHATAAFDGTNITLTWTKGGGPSGTMYIMWEAYA